MSTPYFDRNGRLVYPQGAPSRSGPLGPSPITARGRRLRVGIPRFGAAPGMGAFGDPANSLNSVGAAPAGGGLIPSYTEVDGIFNPAGITAGSSAGSVALSTAATPSPTETGYMPMSAPFGESDRAWSNPTTFASVPINASTNTQTPILAQNYQRNALIIQNGSLATVAGDVAPTLYVGFNAQPQVGGALALPPGVGVVFDIICPRDAIFIAFGPFTNTGGSVVIQGVVLTGTYSP